jgi:beta-lactamase class A
MSAERVRQELRCLLADAGLSGSFLVRDLSTGEEIGIDPEVEFPVASLAKLPLAIAVASQIHNGQLDGAAMIEVPPAEVDQAMRQAGIGGITIRHRMRELTQTPTELFGHAGQHLAHLLAIGSGTPGRGHALPQLDITRANSGTARAFTDLLHALWVPSRLPAEVAARVRSLMAENMVRHRLAPDFSSDSSTWSSKTGTLLNLRHEVGVVEHDDGSAYAIAALTESRIPAATQPGAEVAMARVARALHEYLRF